MEEDVKPMERLTQVFGEDPSRDAVPEAGREGQEALPNARRSARKRRAPRGERNGAYKHGLRTEEAIAERRKLRALIRAIKESASRCLSET